MPTLSQASDLLCAAYGLPENGLKKIREDLRDSGMLPHAVGRDIPLATPARLALLVLGLGVDDPERIAELADLRRFKTRPGDMEDNATLGQVLGYTIKGLVEQPDVGVDMKLSLTVKGPPFAFFVGNGQCVMQFGEPFRYAPPIHHTVTIDLMPLNAFCDAARATQPPYKVK